jgi:sporulation-control protein spo0M
MGFFQTIKNKLGIGGVKVSLQIPAQAGKNDGKVEGKITLTTKSEQEVINITVKMLEEYSTGIGAEKKTTTLDLGVVKLPGGFTIKPGDTKEITFSLPYAMVKSENDKMKEQGGLMGKLGSVNSFVSNEKSKFYIDAEADVKSAALDPSDKKEIKLT